MTEQGTSFAFRGVVTQITATLRLRSGWSGQHGLLDYSCKPSPFRAGLLTTLDKNRPAIPYGVASGDINNNSAVIWSRSNRPARMIIEYATDESFRNVNRIIGKVATEYTDFTARTYLDNLPPGQDIFYRVTFQDLVDTNIYSAPVIGHLKTAPQTRGKDILFAWSGDTAGQGWGINSEWGGMKIYESIRQLNPDFFI
ncbi:PhoD-like phosphatase N-terminal domain-containing protein, partial [Dolichospermum sp. ST_sed5]|nr:PhoD-like phosphatase N-terminal domain-containing protein [Dolichospermum sp. ST_sed5]